MKLLMTFLFKGDVSKLEGGSTKRHSIHIYIKVKLNEESNSWFE